MTSIVSENLVFRHFCKIVPFRMNSGILALILKDIGLLRVFEKRAEIVSHFVWLVLVVILAVQHMFCDILNLKWPLLMEIYPV